MLARGVGQVRVDVVFELENQREGLCTEGGGDAAEVHVVDDGRS